MVAWFEDVHSGEVTSVSFAEASAVASAQGGAGSLSMDDFRVPEFVVATKRGKILKLDSKTMERVSEEAPRGRVLVSGFDGDVLALAAHPALPVFAVGTFNGVLQLWDLDDRIITASRAIQDKHMPVLTSHASHLKEVVPNGVVSFLQFSPKYDSSPASF